MSARILTAVECLVHGGVVLLPTDTVYGLAANPEYPDAVERIFKMKERPRDRPLPIMVSKMADLERLGLDINPIAKTLLMSTFVPGQITLVLGFYGSPAPPWLSGREEVAIRIPNDTMLLEILARTGPLLVTSANKHSNPKTPSTIEEIVTDLSGEPDLIIDGGRRDDVASTIVNCRFTPPKFERVGNISPDEILRVLANA